MLARLSRLKVARRLQASGLITPLWVFLQRLLPQRLLSRAAGHLGSSRRPWLKDLLIRLFLLRFSVNMEEAERADPRQYACFNDFFTRALKDGARPLAKQGVVSPVDGTVSRAGQITRATLMQAKGRRYSLSALLADDASLTRTFLGGMYATFYLAPKDYHRIHMPLAGTLQQMLLVPGRLFSVDQRSTQGVDHLFARNERLISVFATKWGAMAIIMVGAMVVSSMATVWHGRVRNVDHSVRFWRYTGARVRLARGAEMGRFAAGSTVIVLFPRQAFRWLGSVRSGRFFRMGEQVGEVAE